MATTIYCYFHLRMRRRSHRLLGKRAKGRNHPKESAKLEKRIK